MSRLIQSLVASANGAADSVLLEALEVGQEQEQLVVLDALMQRQTVRGLQGVVVRSPGLSRACWRMMLERLPLFRQPIRLASRDTEPGARLAAIGMIRHGDAAELAYLLCEHLRDQDETVAQAASASLTCLTLRHRRRLSHLARMSRDPRTEPETVANQGQIEAKRRMELEAALLRAAINYRGPRLGEVARAMILLLDAPSSVLMPVMQTEHQMLTELAGRQLQRPTRRSQVPAMLVACTRGTLRARFPTIFSHLSRRALLSSLVSYSHRLKDRAMQIPMKACIRGAWLEPTTLSDDLMTRTPLEAAQVAQWILASGLTSEIQAGLLRLTYMRAQADVNARATLLRHVLQAAPEVRMPLLRHFVNDPDDGIAACATRELARLGPEDLPQMLLPLLKRPSRELRMLVSRLIGPRSFEQYWNRYEGMTPEARQQSGKAMLKMATDAPRRLGRLVLAGSSRDRLKAIGMIGDLGLVEAMSSVLRRAAEDPDSRIRSHVVMVYRGLNIPDLNTAIVRAMLDADERVRANAIEVIEQHGGKQYATLLNQRTTSRSQRERGNAIRVLCAIDPMAGVEHLTTMLRDGRPEHRISALWVIREVKGWQMLQDVASLAKGDPDVRVRRYAGGVLRGLSSQMHQHAKSA